MSNKVKQFVAFGVASVVALVVCMLVLIVTVNNLGDNTDATENKTIVNRTELDSSNEALTKYINELVFKTDGRFIKTKAYTDVSVNDLKVLNSSENNNDEALFNFAKDRLLPYVDGLYKEDLQGCFEKNNSKKLDIAINKNAVLDASFSIGQVNENGESVFDDDGNLVDNEYYYLTYVLDIENKAFSKKLSEMLSVKDDLSAKESFINVVKDNCNIYDFEATPTSFIIKAKVNRSTDEISYINVIRGYEVTLNGEFKNDAVIFGEKMISFNYTVTDTYEYSYAGISFVEDEVTIEQNEEYMLNVNAVIDDDSEYTVEFESSMEDLVSVDEMGYIKGLKNSDAPTIITVKLNYLGETFTDTCVVYVDVKEAF